MELKIGTIMNIVYRCTKATTTEKLENRSHSTGWGANPDACKNELTTPFRPSSGTHETIRMTFDVQNGIVHTRNSTICMVSDRTWKTRKYAMVNPSTSVTAHTTAHSLSVDQYVLNVRHNPGKSSAHP